uniref:Endonuclease/exonuclease/phosphatase domain-containing protein n=1 Tax=Gouania willdenowi TaxID=441366 RepID=A0A8C5FZ81_GOUWI
MLDPQPIKKINCQIAFLQETHQSDTEHDKLKKSWAYKVFNSSHQSVNGFIDGIQVFLMNIYTPNEDVPGFISKIFTTIIQHSTGILLLGGDCNCVMSQFIDKQPPSRTSAPRMSKRLKYLSIESGLVDVCGSKYPKSRDFTFYSHRHSFYLRIDLFFTPKSEIHRIKNIQILPITLSDQAPLGLMRDLGHRPTTKEWRLNRKKKEKASKTNTFREQNKKKLEQQHKRTPTSCLLDTLKQARRDLNTTNRKEGNLRFTNQKYYENGKRARRLLALRLKKQQSSNIVHKLQYNNSTFTRPDEISQEFAGFYESLYSNTDTCIEDRELTQFLKDIKLQELSEPMAK